ncbi:MAG: arginase family protein [Acidobacteria bacterium]|nr:arginase family protein [Acidobacteriota bacterium]
MNAALFESQLTPLRTGIHTFLGLPLEVKPRPASGVVLGAPFDGGVIHRPGARLGPWSLRAATLGMGRLPMPLRLQRPEEELREAVGGGWVDGGNLPTLPFGIPEALQAVEEGVAAWGPARTLLLGGDHLMTLGALRAQARRHGPLGLLMLDAHQDAAGEGPWGTPLHHGSWLRRALEEGLLEGRRVLLVGLRAPRFDRTELDFLARRGARLWTPGDLRDPHLQGQLLGDIGRVGQGPAYVSLDLDALDPSVCPAVAEPVPGGLALREIHPLLHALGAWRDPWVGADIMELSPTLPGAEDTARVAAHLALHLMA